MIACRLEFTARIVKERALPDGSGVNLCCETAKTKKTKTKNPESFDLRVPGVGTAEPLTLRRYNSPTRNPVYRDQAHSLRSVCPQTGRKWPSPSASTGRSSYVSCFGSLKAVPLKNRNAIRLCCRRFLFLECQTFLERVNTFLQKIFARMSQAGWFTRL
jgi:hypothetical protein